MKKYLEVVHLDSVKSRSEFTDISNSLDKKCLYTFREFDGWEYLCIGELFSAGTWTMVMTASSVQSIKTIAEDEIDLVKAMKDKAHRLQVMLATGKDISEVTERMLLKAIAVASNPKLAFKEL